MMSTLKKKGRPLRICPNDNPLSGYRLITRPRIGGGGGAQREPDGHAAGGGTGIPVKIVLEVGDPASREEVPKTVETIVVKVPDDELAGTGNGRFKVLSQREGGG